MASLADHPRGRVLSPVADSVQDILTPGVVSEIVRSVVGLVSIVVAHIKAFRPRTDKGLSDKLVNDSSPP